MYDVLRSCSVVYKHVFDVNTHTCLADLRISLGFHWLGHCHEFRASICAIVSVFIKFVSHSRFAFRAVRFT